MITRLQEINGDRVLEITKEDVSTVRLSENTLLRQQEYLVATIATFQAELNDVNAKLAMITEKHAETLQAQTA
jgi:hypothetical protein